MESVKLRKVIKNIENLVVKGSKEIEITGISSDSRAVAPGNLFIAIKGDNYDGSEFIEDAIQAGAAAVVTDLYNPFLDKITQIITKNPKETEAEISSNYYEDPSKELFTIGITGTSGKTTTSYAIHHVLTKLNIQTGLIGTIEYIIGQNRILSSYTTPSVVYNHKYLREMIIQNCKAMVMEVSSHGLEQKRVDKIGFDASIFLNISPEHLDYHKTMENYFSSKAKIFNHLKNKNSYSIINIDDKNLSEYLPKIESKVITIGTDNKADIYADNISYSLFGMYFNVAYKDQNIRFFSSLIGKYNIYNLLSAIAIGIINNSSLEDLKKSIASFSYIPGRLQRVKTKHPFHIFIDYAHKENALFNVLTTLNEIKKGRIITVFGCGGNRDKEKRPKMAKVSAQLSDITIVTNDNPRKEDPQAIIDEIISGFLNNDNYIVEKDRKSAIEKAISIAKKDDIVLIAGKGHEKTQIFSDKTLPFDDVQIVKEVCLE